MVIDLIELLYQPLKTDSQVPQLLTIPVNVNDLDEATNSMLPHPIKKRLEKKHLHQCILSTHSLKRADYNLERE